MTALGDVKLHLVDNLDTANAFKRWLGERRRILAVDTETEGLNPMKDKVRLIQFGDTQQGWTIPEWLWGGLAREAFAEYEGDYVFHNGRFDLWELSQHCGIDLPHNRVHDTMIMAHVLDATRTVGLKDLACMLIDPRAAVAQSMLDQGMAQNKWTWATVPLEFDSWSVYAAMDTVLTAQLFEKFEPEAALDAPAAYDLERAFTWVVLKMEQRGAKIDRPYTQARIAEFETYSQQLAEWCETNYGVSPGSDVKVLEILQRDTQFPFTKRTKSGRRLSLDAEVLEGVTAYTQHPLAQVVLDHRRTTKLTGTYLENFDKYADEDDVLRPSMKAIGARTGRMSMSEPNLHNLPRRNENNPRAITVRNCIVPRDGNVLLLCDFDQIEARMMADLGEDPGLIQAFVDSAIPGNPDFFTAVARELYQDPTLVKADPRRQFMKNGIYALGYGAGNEKIAVTTGTSIEQVNEFVAGLGVRFPGINRLKKQVGDDAWRRQREEGRGYVRSPLTNRRHWADENKAYALVNYLIQGTAAEVLKMKSCELANAGMDEFMTLLVHDEVIMDVPVTDVAEVAAITQQIMNDYDLFSVPITAGIDYGLRWGEKGSVTLEQLTQEVPT